MQSIHFLDQALLLEHQAIAATVSAFYQLRMVPQLCLLLDQNYTLKSIHLHCHRTQQQNERCNLVPQQSSQQLRDLPQHPILGRREKKIKEIPTFHSLPRSVICMIIDIK